MIRSGSSQQPDHPVMSGSISSVSSTVPLRPQAPSGAAASPPASGGGSAASGTTSVSTNADGSVTTTVTDAKGNVVSVSTVSGNEAGGGASALSDSPPGSLLNVQA